MLREELLLAYGMIDKCQLFHSLRRKVRSIIEGGREGRGRGGERQKRDHVGEESAIEIEGGKRGHKERIAHKRDTI